MLELEPGFQVIGEATNGEEAIARYHELQKAQQGPDIVPMAIQKQASRRNRTQATNRARERKII